MANNQDRGLFHVPDDCRIPAHPLVDPVQCFMCHETACRQCCHVAVSRGAHVPIRYLCTDSCDNAYALSDADIRFIDERWFLVAKLGICAIFLATLTLI